MKRLDQLKTVSFDFRFAQAEAYYYQRYQEMLEKACKHKMVPEEEVGAEEKERRPQSEKKEDAKKWRYLVSDRAEPGTNTYTEPNKPEASETIIINCSLKASQVKFLPRSIKPEEGCFN